MGELVEVVADPPARGRVQPFVVPARELATTVHRGWHDAIDVSGRGAWHVRHRAGAGLGR
jgi:hypothetical protein